MLHHSVMSDSAALWTVAHQAPLSMGFSRQEYWSRLPFPTLEDLPNPGTEPKSLMPPALPVIFYHWAAWEIPRLQQCTLNCSIGSDSLQPQGLRPTRPLCPWNSPGKSIGMCCHFLLQGVSVNQGDCSIVFVTYHHRSQQCYTCGRWGDKERTWYQPCLTRGLRKCPSLALCPLQVFVEFPIRPQRLDALLPVGQVQLGGRGCPREYR